MRQGWSRRGVGVNGAIPFGGKRARQFAGPRSVAPGRRVVTYLADEMLRPEGLPVDLPEDAQAAETVLALPAGPRVRLGAFLAQALPGLLEQAQAAPELRLAGPAPTAPQSAVLVALGLSGRILPLIAPRRFAGVISCGLEDPRAPVADDAYKALLEVLRAPEAADVPFAVALLPPPLTGRVGLRNRGGLAAWLRGRRFALPAPEQDAFSATAALLARATLLLLADPAQTGLLGLLPRGAQVLEVAPEGFAGTAVRGSCAALGLRWHLLLAGPATYSITHPPAFGGAAVLGYEVPISLLSETLDRL